MPQLRKGLVSFFAVLLASCTLGTPSLTPLPPRPSRSPLPSPTITAAATSSAAPNHETFDYLALGDSFTGSAVWPEIYASFIEDDLLVDVVLHMEAIGGQIASAALQRMRTDDEFRRLIMEAEVITINLGVNSLEAPFNWYSVGLGCGGQDNQDCIRGEISSVKADWSALLEELVSLRDPEKSHIVTFKFGTWLAEAICEWGSECWEVLLGYLLELNEFIERTANEHGIQVIDVNRSFNGSDNRQPVNRQYLLSDRLHVSEDGSVIIADLLRELEFPEGVP